MSNYASNSAILDRRNRLCTRAMEQGRARAKSADPRTGGHPDLVNNWGNRESKRVWDAAFRRQTRILRAAERLFKSREHATTHGPAFRPLWCAHCQEGGAR